MDKRTFLLVLGERLIIAASLSLPVILLATILGGGRILSGFEEISDHPPMIFGAFVWMLLGYFALRGLLRKLAGLDLMHPQERLTNNPVKWFK